MPPTSPAARLFDRGPRQWGLRGDPHLWGEMKEGLEEVEMPSTTEELRTLITRLFRELTDHDITEPEPFFVERFAHGGMSSGYVMPKFWREKGIPFLIERRAELGSGTAG